MVRLVETGMLVGMVTKRRCTALRVDGEACRAWAVRARDGGPAAGPALCAAHGGLRSRAAAVLDPIILEATRAERLYEDHFSDEEFAALEAMENPRSLESEVRLVRVALRRLLGDFQEDAPDMDKRARTLFWGTEMVARLLQAETAMEGDRDEIPEVIARALDELGEELGLDL